ncbi:MAG: class I SAM-dependent methyltransferase [Limnohabitans sp.]|nr:class I SAM-dependent methyltransferase [Limnohabitans sp.]
MSQTFFTQQALDLAPRSAKTVLKLLERLQYGTLTMELQNGNIRTFGKGALHARINIRHWNVFKATMDSGDIGFAEGFIAGHWTTPDLTQLLRVLIANRQYVEDIIYGNWLGSLIYRIRHWMRRNNKQNSSKNIQAHYDLGNDFYKLWLDPSMLYSSAWFDGNFSQPLIDAQWTKLRRAFHMAGITPQSNQRILEIGCGWGALAQLGVQEFGAQVTGVTLSHEQLAYAQQRMQWNKLNADLRLQDYRDINDEPFDAIFSIEMIEAVGQAYWPAYFQTVSRLLKPNGKACIQSIVIDVALFDRYVQGTDFIQQYIFPGGCLPSPHHFKEQAQMAGLGVVDTHHFGKDYAETLRRWREQFLAELESISSQGFDTPFIRTWGFYLSYCEAAFEEGNIDVVQYTLRKI